MDKLKGEIKQQLFENALHSDSGCAVLEEEFDNTVDCIMDVIERNQSPETGQVDAIVMRIACAIMSYEMDAPHVEMPDFTPDEVEHYPEVTAEQIKEWQSEEHQGDCINMPITCMRCEADMAVHKAEFIASKLYA